MPTDLNEVCALFELRLLHVLSVVCLERCMSSHLARHRGHVHSVCSDFFLLLLSICATYPAHAENHVS